MMNSLFLHSIPPCMKGGQLQLGFCCRIDDCWRRSSRRHAHQLTGRGGPGQDNYKLPPCSQRTSLVAQKESACSVGDSGSTPRSGRSPGEGHGNPPQYSCLENPMDRRAWQAMSIGSQSDSVTNTLALPSPSSLKVHSTWCSLLLNLLQGYSFEIEMRAETVWTGYMTELK